MYHAAAPAAAGGPMAGGALDTQHEDLVHDAQLDYYGRRLATASSDRTVRVFDVSEGGGVPGAVLRGHEGPVWQVSWAHPRFGALLASGSYDGRVVVWKEEAPGRWVRAKEHRADAGVNAVSFCGAGPALRLAAGLADGRALVLSYDADAAAWAVESVAAHQISCNAVAWSADGARLATGGSDNAVREWAYPGLAPLGDGHAGHADWVRDVAYVGPDYALVSASQDRRALQWRGGVATAVPAPTADGFGDAVWRVSVSPHGALVALAVGDGRVHLYRTAADGALVYVSDVDGATPADGQ